MNKDKYQKLGDKIVLRVVQVGADKTNFKILKMLPTNVNNIMREIKLTKVPINTRINRLEKVGLVKRWRGTGLVVPTDLGKDFIKIISTGEDIIRDKLMDILKKVV